MPGDDSPTAADRRLATSLRKRGGGAAAASSDESRGGPASNTRGFPMSGGAGAAGSGARKGRKRSAEAGAQDGDAVAGTQQGRWGSSFRTRTLSTVLMIGGLLLVLYAGHIYVCLLIFVIQVMMVHELFKLAAVEARERKLPGFRTQQWYFFASGCFFFYGRFLKTNALAELTSGARSLSARWPALLGWALHNHTLLSYMLYISGFVMFVASLKKGMYLYQFGQYAWTHMILIVVLAQSSFFVANTLHGGLLWFVLPCTLVVVNDIMAYLTGKWLGRTPLTALSPKKTLEGFIGGALFTILFGFYASTLLSRYQWMTCPRNDFHTGWLVCDPSPIYLPAEYSIRDLLRWVPTLAWLLPVKWQQSSVTLKPIQLHALALSVFASLIAPFGGFFASGFKRAFKIKDFGDSVPGHGGVTDRMDCQVVMAVFSHLYFNSVVSLQGPTVGALLQQADLMQPGQQLELYRALGKMLVAGGQRLGR